MQVTQIELTDDVMAAEFFGGTMTLETEEGNTVFCSEQPRNFSAYLLFYDKQTEPVPDKDPFDL